MRKFNITVNGKAFEVEVEEIGGSYAAPVQRPQASAPRAAAPAAAPAASSAPAPAAAPAKESKPVPAGGEKVNAPMPGTILDIKVKEGETIAKGQVLMILEAMKMENEIMSPSSGVITSINASKGASVNTGELLCVIGS